jgi:phosphohistidine swiveling domain-containing protein
MVDRWVVETDLSEEWDFYTRANVGEVFPDPVSPLTFFYFQNEGGLGGSELGFRDAFYRIGVMDPDELPDDRCVLLGVVGGYCYLNASAFRMLGHRAPEMTAGDIDAAFFGDAPGVPEFVVRPGFDRPDLTEKIAATFQWALTTPDLADVRRHQQAMSALRASRPDLSRMSDRELVERSLHLIDTHFRGLFAEHVFVSLLATMPVGIITTVCQAVGRPDDVLRLLAGVGDVESAAPAMEMWALGRRVASSPALWAAFDAGADGLEHRLRASADPDLTGFARAFDEFLVNHGSRGPNEWEPRSPTWETHPELALAAIDRMRLSPEANAPSVHHHARAVEREAVGAEIAGMIASDPEAHDQFLAALAAARVFMAGRERTKTNCVKLIEETRVALLEWGRRCVAAGTFPRPSSFGMLTRPEVFRFLDDPTGWCDVLAQREALYDEVAALQEPFLFVGHPGPMSGYPRRDEVRPAVLGAGGVLQGVPGCAGTARGVARVVLDPHHPTQLEPGDILVAPITDPSWTPLFVAAAAVVVNVGAPLSHAVIVSRELGIPCVVSATDATSRIPDRATVQVDGTTGTVTVVGLP